MLLSIKGAVCQPPSFKSDPRGICFYNHAHRLRLEKLGVPAGTVYCILQAKYSWIQVAVWRFQK